jgi:hypothetical protein
MLTGMVSSIGKIADTSGDKINFDNGILVIDETNNRVGLGTTSPARRLEVNQGGEVVSSKFTGNNASGHLIDIDHAHATHTYNGFRFLDQGDNSKGLSLTHISADGARGKLQVGTSADGTGAILSVDGDNSRVGIGTLSPEYKLNVNGAVGYTITSITSVSDNLSVSDKSIIKLDTSSAGITINGLNGGRLGQIVYLIKSVSSNTVTINHDNSSGEQKIHTPASGGGGASAYTLSNKEGCTLICISASSDTVGSWRIVDK